MILSMAVLFDDKSLSAHINWTNKKSLLVINHLHLLLFRISGAQTRVCRLPNQHSVSAPESYFQFYFSHFFDEFLKSRRKMENQALETNLTKI